MAVIASYVDGECHSAWTDVVLGWQQCRSRSYSLPRAVFSEPINLKTAHLDSVPDDLCALERVRNPDLFFFDSDLGVPICALEATTHSPDGSNIEKRYPLLWASRRAKINAFVCTPFAKRRRGSTQINRFPRRHAERSLELLREWHIGDVNSSIVGYMPLSDLSAGDIDLLSDDLRALVPDWRAVGALMCHLHLAATRGEHAPRAFRALEEWKDRLGRIANTAAAVGTRRQSTASTLLQTPRRWIQVYNSRPDSGHWERGEGQFDSIDGRLMFTLDSISLLPPANRPNVFEFWLPQMTSAHPWIREQLAGGIESKRIRNILDTVADECRTKFADTLNEDDWALLREEQSQRLLLERDDWEIGVFSFKSILGGADIDEIARYGLEKKGHAYHERISSVLRMNAGFYCSYRGYDRELRRRSEEDFADLPRDAIVFAPRLPKRFETELAHANARIVFAEDVPKEVLLALRQMHRCKLHDNVRR